MVKSGVASSASSFLLGSFLFKVAGVSAFTSVGSVTSSAIGIAFLGGLGSIELSTFPLLGSGVYALKKLAA